jgi:PAS domain S-box-containing protein
MLRWLSDRFGGGVGLGAADRRLLREARERSSDSGDRQNGRGRRPEQAPGTDAELRALFNAMSDLVMVIDREGTYISMAPTNVADWLRPDELIGRNVRDAWPAETAEAFVRLIRRVIETGEPARIEYRRPDFEDRWESATISRLSPDRVRRQIRISRTATARRLWARCWRTCCRPTARRSSVG